MKRLFVLIATSIDAFIVLAIAVVVVTLDIIGTVDRQIIDSAILAILALISLAILRDRWRRDQPDRLSEVAQATARATVAETSMIQTLSGVEVGQALGEARRNTDRWYFKGGTGTYLRAKTLPECVELARQRNGSVAFRVEIIDPTDMAVCQRYATFRRSLVRHASSESWTTDRTQREAFATILAACWYRQRFSLLDIDVWLSSTMTTLRYDMSSSCLIVTQEDPQVPAIMVKSDKAYYRRWEIELRYSRDQARPASLDKGKAVSLDEEPTVEQIRQLFTALDLPLPSSFSSGDVADIVRRALKPTNPYD
ncbi:MAG TPA: hypothetical protein VFC00_40600 [Micromonosporaceae bacterium]|nr:hypothetical protein [Micromonosporaceae bacterium]